MPLTDALLLDPCPFDKFLAIRNDGLAGTGTIDDPLSANTPERFDAIMSSIQPLTVVHLGPGMFQTRGYYDGGAFTGYGWQAKGQTRIVGSGKDVTTLQLVSNGSTTGYPHYYAIGHAFTTSQNGPPNLADFLEISDLTIDCGASSQGSQTRRCGAIRIMGNHVRVMRVKVIDWGSPAFTANPCFAISLVTAAPDVGVSGVNDAGIEDCIVLGPTTAGPAVALHVGPSEDVTPMVEACGKVPFIRNCFVDFENLDATYDHRALSMGWCLGGVIEGNEVYNVKHAGLFLQQASIRDMALRNNFIKNVYKGLAFQPGLAPFAPGSLPGTLTRSGTTATVTLPVSHNLAVGDCVQLTGQPHDFDGIHEVTGLASGMAFTFATSVTSATAATVLDLNRVYGRAGKLLIESNDVELAIPTSGELIGIHLDDGSMALDPIYPAYVHGDALVRDNRIRYVDGQFDPGYAGYGLQANGVGRLMVQDQVLELAPANPLRNSGCGAVTYFNNRTPDGQLIQGVKQDNNVTRKYDELATVAEDAFMMGLLARR